jgi:poly(A) polymerase
VSDPFSWSRDEAPRRIISTLNEVGEARFVGGCVRDSLLGVTPGPGAGGTDIDIATTILPEGVLAALGDAGIRAVPTGIEHGTVTAVIDKTAYEITTLRSDVETDGRRAVVAFTDDWERDARRRDFTINAMYLASDGSLFDPTGGRVDLERRQVRFIGDASTRIREDYLRILRFLRFSARFSDRLDPVGWEACVAEKKGLRRLSRERIWQELRRVYTAGGAADVLRPAQEAGILSELIDSAADVELFGRVHADGRGRLNPSLGTAALWPDADPATLKSAFRPSNAELTQLKMLRAAARSAEAGMSVRTLLYRHGRDATLDGLRLASARGRLPDSTPIAAARTMDVPVFPLKGRDVLAEGVAPGPEVTRILDAVEREWIDLGLPPDRKTAIELLRRLTARG